MSKYRNSFNTPPGKVVITFPEDPELEEIPEITIESEDKGKGDLPIPLLFQFPSCMYDPFCVQYNEIEEGKVVVSDPVFFDVPDDLILQKTISSPCGYCQRRITSGIWKDRNLQYARFLNPEDDPWLKSRMTEEELEELFKMHLEELLGLMGVSATDLDGYKLARILARILVELDRITVKDETVEALVLDSDMQLRYRGIVGTAGSFSILCSTPYADFPNELCANHTPGIVYSWRLSTDDYILKWNQQGWYDTTVDKVMVEYRENEFQVYQKVPMAYEVVPVNVPRPYKNPNTIWIHQKEPITDETERTETLTNFKIFGYCMYVLNNYHNRGRLGSLKVILSDSGVVDGGTEEPENPDDPDIHGTGDPTHDYDPDHGGGGLDPDVGDDDPTPLDDEDILPPSEYGEAVLTEMSATWDDKCGGYICHWDGNNEHKQRWFLIYPLNPKDNSIKAKWGVCDDFIGFEATAFLKAGMDYPPSEGVFKPLFGFLFEVTYPFAKVRSLTRKIGGVGTIIPKGEGWAFLRSFAEGHSELFEGCTVMPIFLDHTGESSMNEDTGEITLVPYSDSGNAYAAGSYGIAQWSITLAGVKNYEGGLSTFVLSGMAYTPPPSFTERLLYFKEAGNSACLYSVEFKDYMTVPEIADFSGGNIRNYMEFAVLGSNNCLTCHTRFLGENPEFYAFKNCDFVIEQDTILSAVHICDRVDVMSNGFQYGRPEAVNHGQCYVSRGQLYGINTDQKLFLRVASITPEGKIYDDGLEATYPPKPWIDEIPDPPEPEPTEVSCNVVVHGTGMVEVDGKTPRVTDEKMFKWDLGTNHSFEILEVSGIGFLKWEIIQGGEITEETGKKISVTCDGDTSVHAWFSNAERDALMHFEVGLPYLDKKQTLISGESVYVACPDPEKVHVFFSESEDGVMSGDLNFNIGKTRGDYSVNIYMFVAVDDGYTFEPNAGGLDGQGNIFGDSTLVIGDGPYIPYKRPPYYYGRIRPNKRVQGGVEYTVFDILVMLDDFKKGEVDPDYGREQLVLYWYPIVHKDEPGITIVSTQFPSWADVDDVLLAYQERECHILVTADGDTVKIGRPGYSEHDVVRDAVYTSGTEVTVMPENYSLSNVIWKGWAHDALKYYNEDHDHDPVTGKFKCVLPELEPGETSKTLKFDCIWALGFKVYLKIDDFDHGKIKVKINGEDVTSQAKSADGYMFYLDDLDHPTFDLDIECTPDEGYHTVNIAPFGEWESDTMHRTVCCMVYDDPHAEGYDASTGYWWTRADINADHPGDIHFGHIKPLFEKWKAVTLDAKVDPSGSGQITAFIRRWYDTELDVDWHEVSLPYDLNFDMYGVQYAVRFLAKPGSGYVVKEWDSPLAAGHATTSIFNESNITSSTVSDKSKLTYTCHMQSTDVDTTSSLWLRVSDLYAEGEITWPSSIADRVVQNGSALDVIYSCSGQYSEILTFNLPAPPEGSYYTYASLSGAAFAARTSSTGMEYLDLDMYYANNTQHASDYTHSPEVSYLKTMWVGDSEKHRFDITVPSPNAWSTSADLTLYVREFMKIEYGVVGPGATLKLYGSVKYYRVKGCGRLNGVSVEAVTKVFPDSLPFDQCDAIFELSDNSATYKHESWCPDSDVEVTQDSSGKYTYKYPVVITLNKDASMDPPNKKNSKRLAFVGVGSEQYGLSAFTQLESGEYQLVIPGHKFNSVKRFGIYYQPV